MSKTPVAQWMICSLAPSIVNNSYLFDGAGLCDASAPPIQCLGRNGGAFDPGSSSSWTELDRNSNDHTADPLFNVSADIFGTDVIHFNLSTSLQTFPIHIPRNRNALNMNTLGFGPDSTILNGLRNSGIIASRTWSILWGLTGVDSVHQMDGSLVIGGYDAAKIQGENHTSPLQVDQNCPSNLLVTVTNIEMEAAANGSVMSIMGGQKGHAIQMCITPDYPLITISEQLWNIFQELAGGSYVSRSFGTNIYGEVFEASDV